MAKLASKLRFGQGGVDFDEGINFTRMREERLAKAQSSLKRNGVAACLLVRPENIRYVTSTKFVDFIDQLRYSVAFAEHDPIIYEASGRTLGTCPWIKPENVRLAKHWANGSCGPEATWERAQEFARLIKEDLQEKGLEKEKLGIDRLDEPAMRALREEGIEVVDAIPSMLEARAVKTEDEINCIKMAVAISEVGWYALYEAAKPGVRDQDLEAIGTAAVLQAGAESIWGITVSCGPRQSSDRIVNVGDVLTADFVRVSYLGYNTCYYRNIIVGRKPNEKEKDLHKRSYERVYKVIDTIKPGATTADSAKNWIKASERGLPTEEYTWCDELGHGLGLWLYEYPIINRLWSLDHPMIYEKGMTLAVEAMEFSPEIGRTKLEEMIVITDNGAEVITRMPVKDMMVASSITVAE